MKLAFHILLFLSFALRGQISAPSLRCLEVAANGDVKLTWIPASDPANVFFSYEVFASISQNGPYTNVGSVGALGLNNYTHVGGGANIQSRYYFVRTAYGAGGINKSTNSDTLRSIFLNIIPSTPDLKLLYNTMHSPKLVSASTTYTINKEFPSATWSILGITSSVNYADTMAVCSASINYQVSLHDNSGCVSTSNVQGGVYNDKKDPDVPVVDSISVLPNGQTILAWSIPRDPDIVKYQIYHNVGTNMAIDQVQGRNSTSYTFTSTIATSSALALYVAAIDSCNRISSFSITPTTIFLQTTYDKCGYKTRLNWNAYQGMKGGIKEYRVYYSANGSVFTRVGTTTGTSFTHEGVAPMQNICYFVRVVNTNQTITASSNRACFFSNEVPAANFIYIINATVTGSVSARVNLLLDTSEVSSSIDIQRSNDGSVFATIANLPFTGQPIYSYNDENISTSTNSYYYRAIVRDSCANVRTISNISKTILLKVEEDKNLIFNKNLRWSSYSGFGGGVAGYNIYRIINNVISAQPVGSRGPSDTTYTDNIEEEANNGAKIEYVIEAVEGLGNVYGFLEAARSNTVDVYQEDKLFIPSAFAPRGKNRVWLPVTHFVEKTEYSVIVYNRWGNKVFESSDDKQGWDGSSSPPDIYVYLIRFKNSRGEYKEEKGTVLLLE